MDKVVVFDLDDTLYKEIDFLNSAFKEIALNISNDSDTSFNEKLVTCYIFIITKKMYFKVF